MSADDKHAEALARIEHKIDLLMRMIATLGGDLKAFNFLQSLLTLPAVGGPHKCFLCANPVEYSVDPVDAVVTRKCGCKTGKIALDLKAFAPPVMSAKKENTDAEQHEDWFDSSTRGSSGRR